MGIFCSHHGGMFFEVMLRNDGVADFVKSWESGNEAQKSEGQHCVANVSLKKTKVSMWDIQMGHRL